MVLQSSCVGSLGSRDLQMDLRELLKERLLRKENTVVEPWASLTGNPFALLLTLSCKLFSRVLCIESNLHHVSNQILVLVTGGQDNAVQIISCNAHY